MYLFPLSDCFAEAPKSTAKDRHVQGQCRNVSSRGNSAFNTDIMNNSWCLRVLQSIDLQRKLPVMITTTTENALEGDKLSPVVR
jgi:hypothetical protein